ncbi:MAG: hypothetical protein IJ071_01470 [Ruminococcus sp.]|nr:hypothetical protein [Ruminococcus sp.]
MIRSQQSSPSYFAVRLCDYVPVLRSEMTFDDGTECLVSIVMLRLILSKHSALDSISL